MLTLLLIIVLLPFALLIVLGVGFVAFIWLFGWLEAISRSQNNDKH